MNDREVSDQHDPVSAPSCAAALVFVTVLTHTAPRDSIAVVKITYPERLYIWLDTPVLPAIIDVFLVVR